MERGDTQVEKPKLIRIFDKQAARYDNQREDTQQTRWRRRLIGHARGEVLELAVGAGANFPFYPPGIQLTAADFSGAMLEKARQAAARYPINSTFICSDIEELSFPDHSFDTIVSTLSFCSYARPLPVLEQLSRWCRPGGQILLMEHGISANPALSLALRALNPLLYRIYGCHHTRDILGLVRESGLTINKVESHWQGMVHLIWASPQK
ncbi:ubiquinone/menaquinone biosynthesis C-methylase UbiE [Paenibacillus sp. PastF-1]|nr:ubiquinone/menaquinone biosynthesis C-methylase UbiE [Paenibacillus sp. PastF-2]MDF9850931.1 ubiquinone/menaquinone biosynthesis C-methylase UbiE [Paenibacillus sp. PastM-2]MDF9857455.1 ubiquinone/menaquinone biosynthesis C-methylase UbiE [Paenibacillus sp. PastF-1]MDH6482769.1 ubiquinone/menaquinone biosynthesis C-methylase UbiE [Paenibacillus sp. PastH-2]MDH6510195.1 ubiquinone/menaquinone biosynthesis C-methylase UbiE [Paenibacillus sp. PastM-3]